MSGEKFFVYVLRLEGWRRRYVGKYSSKRSIKTRIRKHRNGGVKSTQNLKIRKGKQGISKIYKNQHSYMEDVVTIKQMQKNGIDYVLGGSYCHSKRDDQQIRDILKIIISRNDLCYDCGGRGHYQGSTACRTPKPPQSIYQNFNFIATLRTCGLREWLRTNQPGKEQQFSKISSDQELELSSFTQSAV